MRLLGITLPDEKRLEYALTSVYGIGLARSQEILDKLGLDRNKKAKDVTSEEEGKIRTEIESYQLEGDLKREVSANIKRHKDMGSYRGSRHAHNLPARGQRSKTNSRTVRGNVRKTMGSGRRTAEKT
jgi:small subunit ribosomal protein S13